MYQPTHFQQTDTAELQALMRQYPLATLVVHTADGLSADPVPLLYDEPSPGRGRLRGHVARANPLWQRAGSGIDALAVFTGPQAYVSPSWYAAKQAHGKVVPTWNYATVQAEGRLRAVEDAAWLRELLQALTHAHEQAMPQPWQIADAPSDYIERMLQAIVGIELQVERLQGKWKLSQNRDVQDRQGVIRGLQAQPGAGVQETAQWMLRLDGKA
jgi:transcriptional regulator